MAEAGALKTIVGVEVFRVGTWNGDAYTRKDLDALVEAAKALPKPPLKVGHDFDPTAPAVGYVTNLRREGDVLLADFLDVQPDLYAEIQSRKRDAVSAEIWFNYERDGVLYPKALMAVAILGAQMPGVDLAPLREVVTQAGRAEAVRVFTTRWQEGTRVSDATTKTPEQLAAENASLKAQLEAAKAAADPDLKTKVATLAAENAKLAEQVKALAKGTDAEKLVQLSTENVNLRASQASTQAALETERATRRATEAQAKADRVVVPAFRGTIKALYDLALREPRTVQFAAAAGDPAIETPGEKVVDALVDLLNGPAAKLFVAMSRDGGPAPELASASAGEQLAAKARAYAAAHKVPFDQALTAVRTDPANAHLVTAYAGSGR